MFSLTFEEEPQDIAKEAAIHALSVTPVSVRDMMKLLDRMGLSTRIPGLTWYRDLNWITGTDDTVAVSCNELSGGLQYRLRPLANETGTDVSDDTTVEKIAREFLKQIERPAESEPLHLEAITHLYRQSTGSIGQVSTPAKLDSGVIFTRMIDDLPVVGPGGSAMVNIGQDDTVIGGREVWRPISARGSKVPLRSAAEAMDLLETKLRRSGLDGDYYVCRAWQCYHESGIEAEQQQLEPCYLFVIESDGKEFNSKTAEIIPAARVGPMAAAFTA